MEALFLLCIGILAGVAAGLFGLGGGVVIVPLLLAAGSLFSDPIYQEIHVATATSLASVIIASLSSSISHAKSIHFPKLLSIFLIIGCSLGALVGSLAAIYTSALYVTLFFAIFEILVGLYFVFGKIPSTREDGISFSGAWGLIGFIVGSIGAFLGVGGGFLLLPILCIMGIPIHLGIGLSGLGSFSVAFCSTLGYSLYPLFLPSPFQSSLIDLSAFIWISMGALISAPFSAKMAHRISSKTLQKIFGSVLILIGLGMLPIY